MWFTAMSEIDKSSCGGPARTSSRIYSADLHSTASAKISLPIHRAQP